MSTCTCPTCGQAVAEEDDHANAVRLCEGKRVTPTQLSVLESILIWRRSEGVSPTMQELAECMQVSKVTIFGHVNALVDAGVLTRAKYKSRSLAPVGGTK